MGQETGAVDPADLNDRIFQGHSRFELEHLLSTDTRDDETEEELVLLGPPRE